MSLLPDIYYKGIITLNFLPQFNVYYKGIIMS